METENMNPATESTGNETQTEEAPSVTYAGKYKSVGDLENAYTELQSTFSKKMGAFEAAPEEYTFNSEGFESNEISDALTSWGKENQLSNDGINSLYSAVSELDNKRAEDSKKADEAYVAEQKEALGTNAETRIKNATDWVNANIGEEAAESINQMWGGAKGIEAIEKIMKLSQGITPAPTPAQENVTVEKVNAMQFAKDEYGRYKMDDPTYAAKVREMRSRIQR